MPIHSRVNEGNFTPHFSHLSADGLELYKGINSFINGYNKRKNLGIERQKQIERYQQVARVINKGKRSKKEIDDNDNAQFEKSNPVG